jgi:hypothetical protein
VTFESGSKLIRIETDAFYHCSSLKTIEIPRSTQELVTNWARGSSLEDVIFESAASLRMMIDADRVDLSEGFGITFIDRDCELDFLGDSVQRVSGGSDPIHLTRK